MKFITLFALMSVLLVAGCTKGKSPAVTTTMSAQASSISTSTLEGKVSFLMNFEDYEKTGVLSFDMENNLGGDIYLMGSSGIHPWYMVSLTLEKFADGNWIAVVNASDYGVPDQMVDVPPLKIERGGVYHLEWNHKIPDPVNGTYRFALGYYLTKKLEFHQRTHSHEFTVGK
ncbi:MAG: hypothetical protein V1921_07335 [Candidatus Altiarchaeota archaeon]